MPLGRGFAQLFPGSCCPHLAGGGLFPGLLSLKGKRQQHGRATLLCWGGWGPGAQARLTCRDHKQVPAPLQAVSRRLSQPPERTLVFDSCEGLRAAGGLPSLAECPHGRK